MEFDLLKCKNFVSAPAEPDVNKEVKDYVLTKVLGKGTFGIVYSGYKKDNPTQIYAIKRYFRNLHPSLCHLEILILSYMNKNIADDNIMKIHDGFTIQEELFLVLSYINAKNFVDFFKDISLNDMRRYIYNLLCCLDNIHKIGIVHRDIKPDNFLYDPDTKKCMLIDFGLSEIELEDNLRINILTNINKNTNEIDGDLKVILDIQKQFGLKNRIGTRGFLAPESIFNHKNQTKAVDIWAAGVIFLCFLIKRMPVFNMNRFAKINDESVKELIPLVNVYGFKRIHEIAQKFQSAIYFPEAFDKFTLPNDFESMIQRDDVDEDCLDLLRKMMELDPDQRITADDAKKHKFFNGFT